MFAKVGELYDDVWKAIVRPPRDFYTIEQLGPVEFRFGGRHHKRTDVVLVNGRGLRIQGSHFEYLQRDGRCHEGPCVIYLHGNCSSRLEALHCGALRVLFPLGISVFCFDFTGSGLSDGAYVSLGWYEKEDLAVVVAYLRSLDRVTAIGLWGRSMGAVTACLYAVEDPSMAALVVDSPFASLRRLAAELATDFLGWKLPKFLINYVLSMVRSTVLQKAGFDLDHLKPLDYSSSTFVPALFVAAKDDVFIRPHHAKDLHDAYGGDKNIVLVEGDHNSPRPDFLHDSIGIFFQFALQMAPTASGTPIWNDVAILMACRERQRRAQMENDASDASPGASSADASHLEPSESVVELALAHGIEDCERTVSLAADVSSSRRLSELDDIADFDCLDVEHHTDYIDLQADFPSSHTETTPARDPLRMCAPHRVAEQIDGSAFFDPL